MILITFGTRPEWIKTKPIIDVFDKNGADYRVLHIGQHIDVGTANYYISVLDWGNRLDSIMGSVFSKFSSLFVGSSITDVMIQGDTTSALAVAIAAHHNGMRVIHLEAGLRTYDNKNPWPEEQNRRMISQVSDVHLCPTNENARNLINEEVSGSFYITGNTSIDNLAPFADKCEYANKVLVTMHRRENHSHMREWFNEIERLAEVNGDLEFILPIHHNPDVYKHKDIFKFVNVVEPQSHEDLLNIFVKTRLVITDSGGIQEECSYFNKKCLVCRKVTERPEAVGKSSFMVKEPSKLHDIFMDHIDDYKIDYDCPFGDGNSAERIYNILKKAF